MTALLSERPSLRPEKMRLPGLRPDPSGLWDMLEGSPARFWFDSGASGRTLIAWGPPAWTLSGRDFRAELSSGGGTRRFTFSDPLEVLRDLLGPEAPPEGFGGGAAGYWGYECARYFDPAVRFRPSPPRDAAPDFVWTAPGFWLVIDGRGAELIGQSARSRPDLGLWAERLRRLPPAAKDRPVPPPDGVASGVPSDGRETYARKVREVLRYIAAGDVYQANLTRRMDLSWPEGFGPEKLFRRLRELNPSPYAALLRFPDFALVTCSPELLLSARGRRVRTRPIAGTRPRGRTAREDGSLSGELLLSAKERAEHVMLLDLERNDLGRVCRPGTVRVSESLGLEKYSHVIHIVSEVEGVLREGLDGLDAVRAVFPGGTITGCPKIRCMEILRELEGEPRGPFFGSAGWMGPGGDLDLNILIRTALLREGRMSLRVGAGIVADSEPDREFDETTHKARALLQAREEALHGL
jgi:para-aminobenzoate synthetase component I